jgi:multidrug efflux system membrane fusion protein
MNPDAPAPPNSSPTPAPPAEANSPKGKQRSRKGKWVIIACVVVAGVAVYFYFARKSASAAKAAPAAKGVPVMAVAAKTGDMPVYLYGLGSVTALNTDTMQARVSGELVKVAYTEGQEVQKGDLLAEIDPQPFQVQLTQDEGTLARDQAMLQNAQLELDRYVQAKEAIPQQTIDTQKAAVLQDEGIVKTDQGQVDATQLNLFYCEITAPINGRVGLRMVDPGNQISANTTLVVITQLQPITVVFSLPEDDIPEVQAKVLAHQTLAATAYNHDLSKILANGTLLALDNQVNEGSGTVQLKAIFPNENESLFPNQFVNVRLLLDTLPKVVIVPTEAVQIGPQNSFVYVVKPDNTIDQRTVVPGHVEGDQEVITSGVADGEMVVTDGFDKLQPGTAVTVTQPDAKPATGKPATAKPAKAKTTE